MNAILGVDAAWKSALILAGAGLVTLVLRRSSAALRHLIWSLATAGSLLVPLLAIAVPAWTWSVLPGGSGLADAAGPDPRVSTADGPLKFEANAGDRAMHGPFRQTGGPARLDRSALAGLLTGFSLARIGPAGWMLAGWWVVTAIVLAVALGGRLGLRRLVRNAQPIEEGEWSALVEEVSLRLGLRRKVTLLLCDGALMPMTWGWLRPVVLLPAGADEWSHDRRREVLLHELAHVRRFDCLTQAIAQLACAVYWFNPLAWLAAGRMRGERERACDDIVLAEGVRPSDYALLLMQMARTYRSSRAALSMARPSHLEDRLLAVLDPTVRRDAPGRNVAILAVAALVAMLLPLSAVRLRAQEPVKANAVDVAKPTAKATMTVTGRVLDPDGKPIAGARVAVVARIKRKPDEPKKDPNELYGAGRANAEGRFAIDVPRTKSDREEQLEVIARAPGWGLDGREIDPDAIKPEATITLDPERIIRGRVLDRQGRPVANASLRLGWLRGRQDDFWTYHEPHPDAPGWPGSVTTDAEGRFTVGGLSAKATAWMEPQGDEVAKQQFLFEPGDEGRTSEKTFTAAPAQVVEVHVVRGEDGKPMANARAKVFAVNGPFVGRGKGATTDADGLARVVPWENNRFRVQAVPPEDEPYMTQETQFDWPKTAERHQVELKLRRGVLVRGRLVEEASSKPVAGASVYYYQTFRDNPLYRNDDSIRTSFSKEDGSFTLVVPSGPGHILVQASTPDYLHLSTSFSELGTAMLPNLPMYPDALAHLDFKPDATVHDLTLTLRRGVTVSARVVGPDGALIAEAVVFGRSYAPYDANRIPFSSFNGSARMLHVRGGRVDIPGLDPEKPSTFYVLDRRNQVGATVALSGKSAADGTVSIPLLRCGAATVRYKDESGKPVAGHNADLLALVITPGATFLTEDKVNSDTVNLVNLDAPRNRHAETDADGRVQFVTLIPGASYQFLRSNSANKTIEQAFTAESGKTLDLPDIVLTRERK